jgi:hypothetical protein
MAGDEQDAFTGASPCFQELETAALDHERVNASGTPFGTVGEIMQHA